MIKKTIIDSFNTWTDAQGVKSKGKVKSIDNISLEGIERLRELILELAVRGKLVEQDDDDETGTELLNTIIQTHQVSSRKRQQNNRPEWPFDVHVNWCWAELQQISNINGGFAFKSSNYICLLYTS